MATFTTPGADLTGRASSLYNNKNLSGSQKAGYLTELGNIGLSQMGYGNPAQTAFTTAVGSSAPQNTSSFLNTVGNFINSYKGDDYSAPAWQVNPSFSNNSYTPTTTQTENKPLGLTLEDLDAWWKTKQNTYSKPATTTGATDLSTLYPRVNNSNWQTSNRGNRYFDSGTGSYNLGNTIQAGI